ncbi:hypothetical protein ACFYO0_09435 [Streptomyces sp. NPDC006365]|uniref:hypothetical protein n=1 Tax=Streptomyces sp. NPDC006365 TaxID=3364744 RepID=UPI0036962469
MRPEDLVDYRNPQEDRGLARRPSIELRDLRSREADSETFGFAEPAFVFGFGDPIAQVVPDLFGAMGRSMGFKTRTGQLTQGCSWRQSVP